MPNPTISAKSRHGFLAAALCLLAAGCIEAGPPPQCDALGYKALYGQPISTIEIYDGNRDRRAPEPRLTLRDPSQIAALQAFLLERVDGWFIAAGETYDPDSREANAIITAVFKKGDTAIAQFGYSPASLETPGCDVEVILILSPADNDRIVELLGEAIPSAETAD
ncbi:MAG: hypothetical protein C0421_13780 [Hyphomonas sp.]|uniref:hypothetical protein n=1 Tax=Hyphomonas sp. TaxID=87 RepID=UPI0025BAC26D|nr:hypothetical protein [Hyphomonas sp.]MBA4339898.1 hypothetical protein [Hyphomonas sp.]